MLKVLSFDLNSPSTYCFINLYTAMMNIPSKVKFMAQVRKSFMLKYFLNLKFEYFQYLCELSLLRALPFLTYSTSMLSAAALALSYYTFGLPIWNKRMQDTFGYELEELKEAIVNLNELHFEAETLPQQAIQEKYKASKHLNVSSFEPKKILSEDIDEVIAKLNVSDDLNTTAENIENVRQKTELLLN